MSYLSASDGPSAPAGEHFRALLKRPGIVEIPGAQNGMAALQAKAAGFEALYLSGAAMSASMGLPDLGVITVDEVGFFIRQVSRASDASLAGTLSSYLFQGRDLRFDAQREEMVRALTPEQVNAVMKKRLDYERMISVKAGDFKTPAQP